MDFFHFITFVRIRSRESFFAYFGPDPTQGSRSTSGCKIIKIFMVSCRFFGIKREASFQGLALLEDLKNADDKGEPDYNGCLVKRAKKKVCVFNDLLKKEARTDSFFIFSYLTLDSSFVFFCYI